MSNLFHCLLKAWFPYDRSWSFTSTVIASKLHKWKQWSGHLGHLGHPSNARMSAAIKKSNFHYCSLIIYTILQNKRMRRCGVPPPPPPPIIFQRLKLAQRIIYRRKENLSESPNHQKYWENILVSRFYEQFFGKLRCSSLNIFSGYCSAVSTITQKHGSKV